MLVEHAGESLVDLPEQLVGATGASHILREVGFSDTHLRDMPCLGALLRDELGRFQVDCGAVGSEGSND